MNVIEILKPLRGHAGKVRTQGLDDATLRRLAGHFPDLEAAVRAAAEQFDEVSREFPELLDLDGTHWGGSLTRFGWAGAALTAAIKGGLPRSVLPWGP